MIIMPASHSSKQVQEWNNLYGGLGNFFGVDHKGKPKLRIPKMSMYALDNGAYVAWTKGRDWSGKGFLALCDYYYSQPVKPSWIVVPDRVANKAGTILSWINWEPFLRKSYPGVPLAFAVQNGMVAGHVPSGADIVFVGGTFDWKWKTLNYWCDRFPHVHVGRVNSWLCLWKCKLAGVESCDGTGWFKGVEERHDLHLFLAIQAGKVPEYEMYDLPQLSARARYDLLMRFISNKGVWSYEEEPLFKA